MRTDGRKARIEGKAVELSSERRRTEIKYPRGEK